MDKTQKRKMIPMDEESYEIVKRYCEKHNMKIARWCESVLLEYIERREYDEEKTEIN